VVGAAREKKSPRLSLGLHSYQHQGHPAQLVVLIKAQAAESWIGGRSASQGRRGWATYAAALKGAPASASLHCACSAVLIYLDLR
jgi:hypothetical protein